MRPHNGLRPQDILVLLWLIRHSKQSQGPLNKGHTFPAGRQLDIALGLGLSQAEVGLALSRLVRSRLLTTERRPILAAALEFLVGGLKYVYPAELGPIARGIAAAHSASPLSKKLRASDISEKYVWPDPEGTERGQSLTPLYKSVPYAAKKDKNLYELLALVDVIRVGRSREVGIAVDELNKRFKAKKES